MILNELFINGETPTLQSITPEEAHDLCGVQYLDDAWVFGAGYDKFLIYMEGDVRPEFAFVKLVPNPDHDTLNSKYPYVADYDLTNDKVPFEVLSNVFAALNQYLTTKRPKIVKFNGYNERQQKFYLRAVKYFANRLPKGYYIALINGFEIVVTNDVDLADQHNVQALTALPGQVNEDASVDMNRVQHAQKLSWKFQQWLLEHNADRPLEEIMPNVITLPSRDGDPAFMIRTISAREVGIEGAMYSTMSFAIGWTKDGEETNKMGLLHVSQSEYRMEYFVIGIVGSDPSSQTDVAFSLPWSSYVHELVHFDDYRRSKGGVLGMAKGREKRATKGRSYEYFDEPLELNAHFQQGAIAIMNKLARGLRATKAPAMQAVLDSLKSFEEFGKTYISYMPKQYFLHLSPANKKRFMKRFYKLYVEIRAAWPNIPAIQRIADQLDAWEQDAALAWEKEKASRTTRVA